MKRAVAAPELLDGPLDDAAALRGNLRDLRRINRFLGGSDLSRRAVLRLVGPRPGAALSLVDVGTGAADIALALREAMRDAGASTRVVAVDVRPEVLEAARAIEPALAAEDGLELRVADGRRLPFPDRSFDVAHASLVVHHLEPDEAVAFLVELRRVSRLGVVVNDLVRGRASWVLAWAGSRILSRNRLTRHDAPLSVRRAYTLPELRGLLAGAGLRAAHVALGPLGHRLAVAAVPVAR